MSIVAIVGFGGCDSSDGPGGDGPDLVPPPTAVSDSLNPAILIMGGALSRRRQVFSDSVDGRPRQAIDPRATYDEGFTGTSVPAFWIQQHEVTNEEFARFDPRHVFEEGKERHPVSNVTWERALAYALSLGGRLPTEPEFEFAARGAEGRLYPWGDEEPTCERANHAGCGPRGSREVMTHPAGATPDGVHDLAGNVWEWVTPMWYRPTRTPINDEVRRMRGGSFDDEPFFLRATNRSNGFRAGHRYISVGFRVLWPATRGQD